MRVTILTVIFQGIPEIAFVGSDGEAREIWDNWMRETAEWREQEHDELSGEEPNYTCDHTEATTENAWRSGYFCDRNYEYRASTEKIHSLNYDSGAVLNLDRGGHYCEVCGWVIEDDPCTCEVSA